MMENWTLAELEALLRLDELELQLAGPIRHSNPAPRSGWRRRFARALVDLGLHLDAEASRAAMRAPEPTSRLNGADA